MSVTLNYSSWQVVRIDPHTVTIAVDSGLHVILPRSALPPTSAPGDLLLIVHSRAADVPSTLLSFRPPNASTS
jgi:hypothetical protein